MNDFHGKDNSESDEMGYAEVSPPKKPVDDDGHDKSDGYDGDMGYADVGVDDDFASDAPYFGGYSVDRDGGETEYAGAKKAQEPFEVNVYPSPPVNTRKGPNSSEKKSSLLVRDVYEWVESVMHAVIVIIFIFTVLVRITSVDGESMYPTLHNSDRMLVSNFMYTPKHNDIVVIYANQMMDNGTLGKPIIKRVVGVSGDIITFDTQRGVIYRNGEELEIVEEGGFIYEDGHLINSLTRSSVDLPTTVTVPEGCVFVMGDNRSVSVDSRYSSESNRRRGQYVGMVDENYIVGRAFLRISPLSDFGAVD